MMGIRKKIITLLGVIFLTASFSGCSALVVGLAAGTAGTYVWTHGNLELYVQYSAEDLYSATREALDQINIMVERDRHNRFEADLYGRTERGRKVLIKITGQTERSAKIRVRVGIFGDQQEAQMILNVILGNV